jgi:transcription antitermination factor NusG
MELIASFGAHGSRVPATLYETPNWYALHTRSRHEKPVASLLQRQGIESYLPLLARQNRWKDRVKLVHLPLFPGYVFARFTLDGLTQVLSTHGVFTIVAVAGHPTPIPAQEIDNVRRAAEAAAQAGAELETAFLVEEGTRVRVAAGPFQGVEGTVVERRGRQRVVVGITALGRALEVDIRAADLVPLPE